MQQRPAGADRLVACFSDIEIGAGGLTDDCPHSDWFDTLLAAYDPLDVPVDLVLNGDTFDFLKTPVDGTWPRHVNAEVAMRKLDRVAAAHPAFFGGLRRFLSRPNRTVTFTVGNHDAEILFPVVQQALMERVDAPLSFPGFSVDIGDAHFEHGAQADDMFRMNEDDPFVEFRGERLLRLPWGTVCLLDVAMPIHHLVYDVDRVKPHKRVFELLPDLRNLILQAYWNYWTGEYAREVWAGFDPMRTLSWTLLKEVVYRLRTGDPDIAPSPRHLDLLEGDEGYRVVCVGHLHEAALVTKCDRRLITTGCLRNEYAMSATGKILGSLPKVWAHLWQREGRTLTAGLQEAYGPPPPEGHAPAHIRDILPRIARYLGSRAEIEAIAREEQAQLDRER